MQSGKILKNSFPGAILEWKGAYNMEISVFELKIFWFVFGV